MRIQQESEPGALFAIERATWSVAKHATAMPRAWVCFGHRCPVLGYAEAVARHPSGKASPWQVWLAFRAAIGNDRSVQF
jgi:hypothetical protein